MKHDLEDLIEMIKALESRIIHLESELRKAQIISQPLMGADQWYFHY